MLNYTLNNTLLSDFTEYSQKQKAILIYNKCLRSGKTNIANRIKDKYNIETVHDDTIYSMLLLTHYLKNKENYGNK